MKKKGLKSTFVSMILVLTSLFVFLLPETTLFAVTPGELLPVPIENVTINDSFWAPKMTMWRTTTINDVFTKFENSNAFTNFDLVAQGITGTHYNDPWWDGLVYETIRAAADFMKKTPDSALKTRVDGYINRIKAASDRDPNGYLNTTIQTANPAKTRWADGYNHESYNMGCMIEAAVHYYKATGSTTLLYAACRFANYASSLFGYGKNNYVPEHAIAEEALIDLYKLFKADTTLKPKLSPLTINEDNYRALAEFWVENRGNHTNRYNNTIWGEYAQDHDYYYNQTTCKGHAVRAALFYTGIIAAGRVNGNTTYLNSAKTLWDNMANKQMYVTGGIGSTSNGEAFGGDYILPNDAYAETCAAVGAAFFSHRMSLAFAESKYADVLETELYNGALGGAGQNGTSYFYTNSLKSDGESRWTWHPCPCCPPMFLKLYSEMPSYLYSYNSSSIYTNLYVGGQANINLSGTNVTLTQTTTYPWDGTVTMKVGLPSAKAFSLFFRIPGWSSGTTFAVNGGSVSPTIITGYAQINRTWNNNDTVTITIPVAPKRFYANPAVLADRGMVALQRGPIVYCLEGADNGGANFNMVLPKNNALSSQYNSMLGGIYTITAQTSTGATLTAVPFYARANRTVGKMNVWITENPSPFDPNMNYKIINKKSGKALSCYQGGTANNTNLVLYDYVSAADQLWKIQDAGNGYYKLINNKSGRAASCLGGGTANGTNCILYDYVSATDQNWQITAGSTNYLKLINQKSGRAMSCRDGGTANNTQIHLWDYLGGYDDQDWVIIPVFDPAKYYAILNRNSGKAVSVAGASTADGANIHQWSYLGTHNDQYWQFVDVGNGYYRIVNRNSGKVIDVAGAGTADRDQYPAVDLAQC